jgi:hypothetical protein
VLLHVSAVLHSLTTWNARAWRSCGWCCTAAHQEVQLQHVDELIRRVEEETRKLQDGDKARAAQLQQKIGGAKHQLLQTLDACWEAHATQRDGLLDATHTFEGQLEQFLHSSSRSNT